MSIISIIKGLQKQIIRIYMTYAKEYQLTYKTIDLKLQNEVKTKHLDIQGIDNLTII